MKSSKGLNTARRHAAQILLDALTFKKRVLIPIAAYLGAYIIMTRYLKLRGDTVAKPLLTILSFESTAFCGTLPKKLLKKPWLQRQR